MSEYDIVGYSLGFLGENPEMVCPNCITQEEKDYIDPESKILRKDEGEILFTFCDRCGKNLFE
jgi:hypothetical protein